MESARRASEIHKRRTGKYLRVTEADVENEEMYEEEDDTPPAVAYSYSTRAAAEFKLRMFAYLQQETAWKHAMAVAAGGNNLNTLDTQPASNMALREYYQRFAQQYPMSLASNQYYLPAPLAQHTTTLLHPVVNNPPPATLNVTSSPSGSNPNSPAKSPVATTSVRRISATTAPYSIQHSMRSRRQSANQKPEQSHLHNPKRSQSLNVISPSIEPQTTFTSTPLPEFNVQPFQPSTAPFTTQLPQHIQQYYLPDLIDMNSSVPFVHEPFDQGSTVKLEPTDFAFISPPTTNVKVENDEFLNVAPDWTAFLGQPTPNKLSPLNEDTTDWDDYLTQDANWVFNPTELPQQHHPQQE